MVGYQEVLLLGAQVFNISLAALTLRAALRAYRLSGAEPLKRFATGFGLLAFAHACYLGLEYVAYTTEVLPTGAFDALDALFWAYYAATLAGLGFVFASFGRRPFKWTPVLAPVVLFWGPLLETLVLVAFFFVVLHAGLNHIARARAGSLQTALGFFLLFLGHGLFFLLDYYPLTPRNLYGELASVLGYLLLYLAITRPR